MNQNQFEILKTELSLTQGQMDKYDKISATIKTWAVTLWVASAGWAFQSDRKEIFAISFVLCLVFWFFEGINKTFRENYKNRRDEVAAALAGVFRNGGLPENFAAPHLPVQDFQHLFKHALSAHISLPYLSLAIISIILPLLV